MENNIILEVKNLSVTLGSESILRGISFSVKRGEAFAVIGPNGAGKTVLFQTLLGILPHKGEVRWKEGVRVGYVPQKFYTDKSVPISIKEFFLLQAPSFWFPPKTFFKHLGHELKLVGLSESVLQKQVNQLSGGELQRLLISWTMLNHPDVLLFDEPTTGIDAGFEETIYNIIHRLQDERETTILLISHDLNIVYRHAQNVLCINKEMICQGKPTDVLNPQELTRLYGAGGFYHHLDHVRR